jgi:predicted O-methyltransferase YrrM
MRAWMDLMSVLRTGAPSFSAVNGVDLWGYLKQHPDLEERFNGAMTALSAANQELVTRAYDFSRFATIVDVGGGQGQFLAAILIASPRARGVLVDQQAAVAVGRRYFESQGLAARTETVVGNIFEALPAGYDAYVLKNILHDWSDEDAPRILARCRAAIPPRGTLVIVDAVITPGNDPHPSKWLDLQMMVALGGRERTEREFAALLERAGFRLTLAKPLPGLVGVVEGVPV